MGFVELLGCSYPCLLLDLGHFQPLFLHVLTSPCLSSPSGDLTVNVLVCFMISHASIRLVHLHVFFFPFSPTSLIISIVLSSCLPILSSFNYFIFQLQSFFLNCFLGFSLSLLIFPFYSCTIFLAFSTSSFRTLSIFQTVVLKSI